MMGMVWTKVGDPSSGIGNDRGHAASPAKEQTV